LTPCETTGVTFHGLADGSYRFEVVASDPLSGASSDPGAGWFFRIDNLGPQVEFSTAPPADTTRQDAVFRFAPLEATTGGFKCTLDGKPVDCTTGSLRFDRLRGNEHTFQVWAMDLAGNRGLTSYSWRVDRSEPTVFIVTGPSRTTDQTTAAFNLHSNASPGLFVCQLDDLPPMPCFTAPILSGLSDGKHRLVVWAYDRANNRSASAHYSWTIRGA
jgi:hypothetical protein